VRIGVKGTPSKAFRLRRCVSKGGSFTTDPLRMSRDVSAISMNKILVVDFTFIKTWRIIPFSKWLITMVSKSPKWGYSPSKWPKKWLINRGDPNHLLNGMILQETLLQGWTA